MKRIITIGREFGAGGGELGRRLARELGIAYYDRDIILRTAKASMLQDLEKGKPTEVRMINGYVCQTGDKYGIETPFNDKVVEIVTKIEKGELPLSMDNVNLFDRKLFDYELYHV